MPLLQREKPLQCLGAFVIYCPPSLDMGAPMQEYTVSIQIDKVVGPAPGSGFGVPLIPECLPVQVYASVQDEVLYFPEPFEHGNAGAMHQHVVGKPPQGYTVPVDSYCFAYVVVPSTEVFPVSSRQAEIG